MKKLVSLFIFAIMLFTLSACSSSPEKQIIGYWTSGDQKASVSFDKKGTVVVDDKYMGEYTVFDTNKLVIKVDTPALDDVYDLNMSAEFTVEDGLLVIKDLETFSTYRFFSDDRLDSVINKKYQEEYRNNFNSYMPPILSYPDDWELHLDGTNLEGKATSEELKNDSKKALQLAEKEIISLYENSILKDEFVFSGYVESAVYIDSVFYEIGIYCEDTIGKVSTFYINPHTHEIYTLDTIDFVITWDGTICSGSLLKEI